VRTADGGRRAVAAASCRPFEYGLSAAAAGPSTLPLGTFTSRKAKSVRNSCGAHLISCRNRNFSTIPTPFRDPGSRSDPWFHHHNRTISHVLCVQHHKVCASMSVYKYQYIVDFILYACRLTSCLLLGDCTRRSQYVPKTRLQVRRIPSVLIMCHSSSSSYINIAQLVPIPSSLHARAARNHAIKPRGIMPIEQ
jgi:hypothetical protein